MKPFGAAAFSKGRLNERYLSAQQVCGFAAKLGLLSHEVKKCLPADVQDLDSSHGRGAQAVGVSGERGRNAEERPRREDAVQAGIIADVETNLSFDYQIDAQILLVDIKQT